MSDGMCKGGQGGGGTVVSNYRNHLVRFYL
jgi:hypothetical protein